MLIPYSTCLVHLTTHLLLHTLMNDLICLAIFVGCVLAALGLVRVCDWLQPAAQTHDNSRASAATAPGTESAR